MAESSMPAKPRTFSEAFPVVDDSYGFVIRKAKECLKEMSSGSNQVPHDTITFYLNWCKLQINALHKEKQRGYYGEFENCAELKELEETLQTLKQQLELKSKELNIKEESYPSREEMIQELLPKIEQIAESLATGKYQRRWDAMSDCIANNSSVSEAFAAFYGVSSSTCNEEET